jgi:protease stability complex PrcB-like protein
MVPPRATSFGTRGGSILRSGESALRAASQRAKIAAVAALVLAITGGVVWTQVIESGDTRRLAWQDATTRMGDVLWPKSVTRSFWKRRQVVRYLARTFPRNPPAVPVFDFAYRRLVLIAAGPRSSTGYGVEILRITERRGDIRVLARERTPSLGQHVVPRLTSPYRLITIPATGKRVYVHWQGRP